MMKFTYQYNENAPLIEVTMASDTTLVEAIENFEAFLRASGYVFDGVLDITEEENEKIEEETS